ncbi:hypothetical protein NP493_486g02071 [Ridgeia piscesae]|uniref:Uncharacterized protein n=1 Tax=Ridgeia piscesae TaxID=27915 RepID=A0AAD9NSZ6_RIDPI|nr:hypothetical protein NP493_486g02071 [Ridgeia piscesae]
MHRYVNSRSMCPVASVIPSVTCRSISSISGTLPFDLCRIRPSSGSVGCTYAVRVTTTSGVAKWQRVIIAEIRWRMRICAELRISHLFNFSRLTP